ncbi:MAG: hypothetical protein Tsb0016_05080 [Sphingomonadales bacterium]
MARREVTPFNLSFLDVMFCGFGAVVLLVVLLYGKVVTERLKTHADLRAQVMAMQREVTVSEERIKMRQAALKSTESRLDAARDEVYAAEKRIEDLQAQLQGGPDPAAGDRRIADLEAELRRLQQRVEELRQEAQDGAGERVAAFAGEGRRQYISGLKLGGKRVMILLDASASMLDETIVNVVRLRNMPPERRRQAEKWQQAVRTTRWLLANLDPDSAFQLYAFNTQAQAVLAETAGQWIEARDKPTVEAVLAKLEQELAPEGGTSLENAFAAANALPSKPDNILLVTDGLPTQGATPPRRSVVSGDDRLRHFERAMRRVGRGTPVNTILLPMEGDPVAAAAYWLLAKQTQGSFLTPSRDWP